MFDRALAQRPPTAWQADAALFDSAAASDFATWRIPALQGELSALSRQALARFEAEQAQDDPDEGGDLLSESNPQALPFKSGLSNIVTQFVHDVHVPVGQPRSDAQAHAAVSDATAPTTASPEADGLDLAADAADSAEAASQAASESQSQASADEEPHPDVSAPGEGQAPASLSDTDAADALEGHAAESESDEDRPEVSAQAPEYSPESDAIASEEGIAPATESDLADDDVLAADALAEVEQERAESLAAQALPVGIDPEDVARREAEHYAQGRADGERIAREAMEQEVQAQCTVLAGVSQELHALLHNPGELFEPLKRLALHLAEQITLTQWQSSTHTLEALIQRCLDTLDPATQGAVTVELHPLDKARLQQAAPELIRGMRLDANESLRVGSVRLYANDTVVEDLIDHRLQAIVRSLNIDAQAWSQRSMLLREHSAETLQALVLPEMPEIPEMPEMSEIAQAAEQPPHTDASTDREDGDVHS